MSEFQKMQADCFVILQRELEALIDQRRPASGPLTGKRLVQEARALKWQLGRMARISRAIEVLNSIDPSYD